MPQKNSSDRPKEWRRKFNPVYKLAEKIIKAHVKKRDEPAESRDILTFEIPDLEPEALYKRFPEKGIAIVTGELKEESIRQLSNYLWYWLGSYSVQNIRCIPFLVKNGNLNTNDEIVIAATLLVIDMDSESVELLKEMPSAPMTRKCCKHLSEEEKNSELLDDLFYFNPTDFIRRLVKRGRYEIRQHALWLPGKENQALAEYSDEFGQNERVMKAIKEEMSKVYSLETIPYLDDKVDDLETMVLYSDKYVELKHAPIVIENPEYKPGSICPLEAPLIIFTVNSSSDLHRKNEFVGQPLDFTIHFNGSLHPVNSKATFPMAEYPFEIRNKKKCSPVLPQVSTKSFEVVYQTYGNGLSATMGAKHINRKITELKNNFVTSTRQRSDILVDILTEQEYLQPSCITTIDDEILSLSEEEINETADNLIDVNTVINMIDNSLKMIDYAKKEAERLKSLRLID